ncbi:MAG TPA: hypothetical protein DCY07_00755 [Rhodospirillaceae bacterium]|nr:hypothetical protein [Rhodospirillaceae bacterium]
MGGSFVLTVEDKIRTKCEFDDEAFKQAGAHVSAPAQNQKACRRRDGGREADDINLILSAIKQKIWFARGREFRDESLIRSNNFLHGH